MKLKVLACLSLTALAVSLTPAAHAQTFSVIHTFTGGWDGSIPYAGVTIRNGVLYGTAEVDGLLNWGVVYQAKRSAGDNWSFVPLSYLPISGAGPRSRALFGPDGHLYGTTEAGGTGDGNVYRLTPPSSAVCKTAFCPWQETELHSFSGPDGRQPETGDLSWDQQGNIYGTTYYGGQKDVGTVFKMTPSGDGWVTEPIYSFSGPDGRQPSAGVVIDRNGNLFGTTYLGGHGLFLGNGIVFELKYVDGVGWQEIVLHYFEGGGDGAYPIGGLVFDNSGNLYGTTSYGGSGDGGTVFELSPSGDTWNYDVLYNLPNAGCAPVASLSFDTAGNLYGTTTCGIDRGGTVFKLAKADNGWAYTELHSFDPLLEGKEPMGSVAVDGDGTIYGTATYGGEYVGGTLWMIKP